MSFARYPEYRDSGVAWLGPVPAHWSVTKLKHSASFMSGGTPSKANLEYWDGEIPWASSKDLKQDAISDTVDHVTQRAIDDGASLIASGDLMIVVRGMILAHTFPVTKALMPMAINQDLKAVRVREDWDIDYFASLLRASAPETFRRLDEAGHGTKALRMDAWLGMEIPKPPPNEQRAIVAFLGAETSRIDALLAEQERLIELLGEKRRAVISHAVTKGLNPDVPMKDSGVEWIGEMPAHWRVMPFRHVVEFLEGPGIMAADFREEGTPLLRISSVRGRWATLDGCNFLDSAKVAKTWSHFGTKVGDLIISGSASMDIISEVGPDVAGAIPYTGLIVLRPAVASFARDYIRAVVGATMFLEQIHLLKAGATIQHFGPTHLSLVVVAVPPLGEQHEIVRRIAEHSEQIDALITEARRAIDLLKERRAALITAAVTGQIDVRHLMEPT